MDAQEQPHDSSPIFDNFDIDLVIKVLANTAFSKLGHLIATQWGIDTILPGPFFVFFIPVFYIFQGAKYTDPIVVSSAVYYAVVSSFCELSSTAVIPDSLSHMCRVYKMVFEVVPEPRKFSIWASAFRLG
jgi:hypothetical protein